MLKNPPVSRIVVRLFSPKSIPFTLTLSRLASQKPRGLTLGRVTKVFETNLELSSPLKRKKENLINITMVPNEEPKTNPNVISPSFLSADRASLYETMGAGTNPEDASASIGVGVCCVERLC